MEIAEAEGGEPSGCELDGEGDAVEAAHDVANNAELVRVRREVRADAAGPVDEQGHCRAAGKVVEVGGARDGQWREPELLLGGVPEGFTAGGQHGQLGAAVHQGGDDVVDGREQVLTVVDHEQLWPGGEQGGAGRQDGTVHDVQIKRGGERLGDGGRVGDRREEHNGDVIGADRDLGDEGGLAHASRAEHGDQSLVDEQPLHRGKLGVPTAQPAGGAGQRICRRGGPAGDDPLEFGDGGGRLEPDLRDQEVTMLVTGAKRVGAAAGGVEGSHQAEHRRFRQRVTSNDHGADLDGVAGRASVDGGGRSGKINTVAQGTQRH